jgi:holo-[acyl-carrier protein] synthase
MQLFLGTDICEIDRIQALCDKYGDKFFKKIFTEDEIKYCFSKKNTSARLAARFATKEAVSKALKVGLNRLGWDKGIDWKDVELIRHLDGNSAIKLYNKAKELENQLGITSWSVSVSHGKRDAIATVIGYRN